MRKSVAPTGSAIPRKERERALNDPPPRETIGYLPSPERTQDIHDKQVDLSDKQRKRKDKCSAGHRESGVATLHDHVVEPQEKGERSEKDIL